MTRPVPAASPAATPTPVDSALPPWRRPLAVVAHPDDESFGLGAVLDGFVTDGATPAVLCFTHGEASTLHGIPGDLRVIRADELRGAAAALGIETVELLDEPDGALADLPTGRLSAQVQRSARSLDSDGLVVFDLGGVTGHPDHDAATRAAIDAADQLGLGVLAWTLPHDVATELAGATGAPFVGRDTSGIDLVIEVDRARQLAAVRAHPSQAVPGSVLWRRLELLGDREHLRWLRRPR